MNDGITESLPSADLPLEVSAKILHPLVATMADTYWDPGNLLQITESDDGSEIQCVGRARSRHDARCRWTLGESDATAILCKVKELAVSPPSKVTQEDLESLAKLCLCREYHYPQWFEVAQRWRPVVAKAVEHHERLSKEHGPAATNPRKDTLEDTVRMLEIFMLKWKVEDLQKELSSVRTDLSTSEERRRVVEEELEHAKLKESKLAQEHVDLVIPLQKSGEAEHARLVESLNELDATRSELAKAKTQGSSLRREVGMVYRLLDEERPKRPALEEAVKGMERCVQEGAVKLVESRRSLEEAREMNEKVALELEQRDCLLAEERTKTTKLEEATQHLKHQLSETTARTEHLLEEEKAKVHLLEETEEPLRRRLLEAEARSTKSAAEADRANRDNQALLQDNVAAVEQFDRLQTDLQGVRAEIQRRTDHSSVLGREVQIARVDNQTLLSQNTALRNQITALEASLAKCWRRRLRAWLHQTSSSKMSQSANR